MTAYMVMLLDCDVCGAVLDLGPQAVSETKRGIRKKARSYGWRSSRSTDVCDGHDDLTMPQALDAIERRYSERGSDHE